MPISDRTAARRRAVAAIRRAARAAVEVTINLPCPAADAPGHVCKPERRLLSSRPATSVDTYRVGCAAP